MYANGIIQPASAPDVARFFKATPSIDKTVLGDFIGRRCVTSLCAHLYPYTHYIISYLLQFFIINRNSETNSTKRSWEHSWLHLNFKESSLTSP